MSWPDTESVDTMKGLKTCNMVDGRNQTAHDQRRLTYLTFHTDRTSSSEEGWACGGYICIGAFQWRAIRWKYHNISVGKARCFPFIFVECVLPDCCWRSQVWLSRMNVWIKGLFILWSSFQRDAGLNRRKFKSKRLCTDEMEATAILGVEILKKPEHNYKFYNALCRKST